MEYDPLSIELLSSTEDNNVSIRIFKLSNRIKVHSNPHISFWVHWSSQTPGLLYNSFLFCEQKEERAIKQFQLKTWTEGQIVPSNLDSMIEVIEMVYDWMKQNGKGPITVHCMLVSTVKLRNFRSYFRKFICV